VRSATPTHPPRKASRLGERIELSGWTPLLVFVLCHVPLALAMYRSPSIASAHVATTVGIALVLALGPRIDRVLFAVAYITGAEVLWRLTHAAVPWETGKYAVVITLLVAMTHMREVRWRLLPGLYLLLLLPSAILTFDDLPFNEARQYVSFNLSGPLSLAVAVWFASHVRVGVRSLRMTMMCLLGPIVGVAAITVVATFRSPDVTFGTQSNFDTSGGFGPNQVSAMLGLGAMVAFLQLIRRGVPWTVRVVMLGVLTLLAAQSALTFSRGGLYGAVGGIAVGMVILLRDARSRFTIVVGAVAVLAVANYLVFPRLEQFTSGALSQRFEELDTSNRRTILQEDLRIFRDHPVIGVGPGRARDYRDVGPTAAHTEFSRELAEHGVLGLFAVIILCYLVYLRLRRSEPPAQKALAAAFITWAILFMTHSGMRLAAPGFIFSLAWVTPVGLGGARTTLSQRDDVDAASPVSA